MINQLESARKNHQLSEYIKSDEQKFWGEPIYKEKDK